MNLRSDRNFLKLWTGQTVSEIGSRITREGLPFTALLLLNATPQQMGILAAITSGSVLLFSLASGLIVDRLRRIPVMICADVGRALLLATIPLAASLHVLSLAQILTVAGFTGILTVLFDVAYQSYLPILVNNEDLHEGNRLLTMSASTAEILGPGITGVLVQMITAPIAILLDALSFLVSAGSLLTIHKVESAPTPQRGISLWSELFEGTRAIAAHSILRALALRSLTAFFFGGSMFTLYLLFAIRYLHLSTSALGFTIALGGAGSMLGAWGSNRISQRFGIGTTFFATAVLTGVMNLLIPLAASYPRLGVVLLGTAQFFGDAGWAIYFINETALRQRVAPEQILGRVNAAMQLASRGVLPLGALAGGFLAGYLGVPAALWIGVLGLLASCVWLLPIRGVRLEEPLPHPR